MEWNIEELRKKRRPLWMTQFGLESFADMLGGGGDTRFDRYLPEWFRHYGEEFTPTFDLHEKDGKYVLTVEVPGCTRECLDVSVHNNVLTVSGKKESSREEAGANCYIKESKCGSFSRSIRLTDDFDADNIEATVKEGILTVTIPLKNPGERKKIDIL